jgi:hypothetical protein
MRPENPTLILDSDAAHMVLFRTPEAMASMPGAAADLLHARSHRPSTDEHHLTSNVVDIYGFEQHRSLVISEKVDEIA